MKRPQIPAIGAATLGSGAAVTAAFASACCVGPAIAPIFLSILGASGLVAVSYLRPYTPWMLLGSAILLAFAFRQLYRRQPCADGEKPPVSLGIRIARCIVWLASVLWVVSAIYAIYGFLHE